MRRLAAWRSSPLTWDAEEGGKRPLVCWDDDKTYDLGSEPDGSRFQTLCERMLTGRYYPTDVIEFFGDWQDEGRHLRPGDRVIQRAGLFGIGLWAMTEIFIAESTADACTIGYLTTEKHFGRGQWQAMLRQSGGRLSLRVWSTAGPGSLTFWIGLPVARWMMLNARRRAAESMKPTGG